MEDAVGSLSYVLGIPSEWFEMPLILTYVILPFLFNSYAFYIFLNNKLKIFTRTGIVNVILACILSLMIIRLGQVSLFVSIPIIAFFGIQSWTMRIIFIALMLLLFFYLIPLISSGVLIS
jgi:hypothetical protein